MTLEPRRDLLGPKNFPLDLGIEVEGQKNLLDPPVFSIDWLSVNSESLYLSHFVGRADT